jgi:hypothetical protein
VQHTGTEWCTMLLASTTSTQRLADILVSNSLAGLATRAPHPQLRQYASCGCSNPPPRRAARETDPDTSTSTSTERWRHTIITAAAPHKHKHKHRQMETHNHNSRCSTHRTRAQTFTLLPPPANRPCGGEDAIVRHCTCEKCTVAVVEDGQRPGRTASGQCVVPNVCCLCHCVIV